MWQGVRVLVTGGRGFLGSALVKRLREEGAWVSVLTTSESQAEEMIQADLTSFETVVSALERARPEIIFHLASYGVRPGESDPTHIQAVNEKGTENLLQACKYISPRMIIIAGSWTEYGASTPERGCSEADVPAPLSDYGRSKLKATEYACHWAREHQQALAVLRFASLFGPGELPHRFIPTLLHSALSGQSASLGQPEVIRDFLFLDDAVEACFQAAQTEFCGEIFNIGSGHGLSLLAVVETLKTLVPSLPDPTWSRAAYRPWDVPCAWLNIKKAKESLNWHPRWSLEAALKTLL